MPYEFLTVVMEGGVGVLTLNRPETFNAWNQKMRDELREAMAALVADDSLRVLVITGTGRAFSAGEDVRGMQGLTDVGTRGFRRVARGIHNVFDEIEAIEVPVIAAMNSFGVLVIMSTASWATPRKFANAARSESCSVLISAPVQKNRGSALRTTASLIELSSRTRRTASDRSRSICMS